MNAGHEKQHQQLKVTELERDDMVQLYKEIVEESQRQKQALQHIQVEKEELAKKVSDFSIRNQALLDAEEKALAAARQEGLNVISLKQQVSDLCKRLEDLTKESEEKMRRERVFEQEIFLSGQTAKEIEARRFNLERDLTSAKATANRQVEEHSKLANDLRQEKEIVRIERERNAKLEALLAEFRYECPKQSGGNDFGPAFSFSDGCLS